jgi:hypothetical protein
MSCSLVQDLLTFAKTLQGELRSCNSLLQNLHPALTLIGSVAEATRVGIGNELDLTVEFKGFKQSPPFQVVDGDHFHLTAVTENVPDWMRKYFDKSDKFIYILFMVDFLDAVSFCIDKMYREKKVPEKLLRGTTNKDFASDRHKCKECGGRKAEEKITLFQQCEKCVVTVSQTKMGGCLQFMWDSDRGKIYSSVDLVPTFEIKDVGALELARIVNTAMLEQQPEAWFRYLQKYATSDLILTDLLDAEDKSNKISSVLLKQLNCETDKNYFVRPGQHLGVKKFSSESHHELYCYIKVLKKVLHVDLSQYMVKKLLLRPSEFSRGQAFNFLYSTMCETELREKFESKIDYPQWEREEFKWYVPLKKIRK